MTAKSLAAGRSEDFVKDWPRTRLNLNRALDFLYNAVFQLRTYRRLYAGVMHALIFWGVTIQVAGTIVNLMQMQLFFPLIELPFPRGQTYLTFELIMDLAGIAILVGVLMALVRRVVLRPKTLETKWDDLYALILLGLIPLAGFTLEGLRLTATAPAWRNWSPAGSAAAAVMQSFGLMPERAAAAHSVFFWLHAGLGLLLLASIPYTKLRHLVYTPLNVIFRPRRNTGELEQVENIDEAETLGVGRISEFTSHQLLSFDACVRCGRCIEICPAAQSGMPYSPRDLIQTLRSGMMTSLVHKNGNSETSLYGEGPLEEAIWWCTTCGGCLSICPAFVNPVDEIVDLRRYKVLTTGKMPKQVSDLMRNMERQGNPWGMPPDARLDWLDGLSVRELAAGEATDVLFFTGCAAAYDERNKKPARAFVRLLQQAGVDFAILGFDEMCCGEAVRRLGHEALYQELARQNVETFGKVSFNRIVTQCPHCYNTLKNEYPQFGGNFKVQHYTEYLMEQFPAFDSVPANGNGLKDLVAYHDSCYLGRYNQLYQPPRRLLENSHIRLVEMGKHGEESFCCGGGGGQAWMETDPATRINHRRLAQVLETGANSVATACPYCLLMFEDAIRSKGLGEDVKVFDIAEIMEKQLAQG